MTDTAEKPASPQDPYRSFLVSASAGSGKTYQLSRRFLHLVAAGAEPAAILTVTFTIKAAAEMRTRILEDAAQLIQDPKLAAEFAENCRLFYDRHQKSPGGRDRRLPPPLSPSTTGEKILAAAQALKITTIDAIFLEWVARFPYEAGADPTGEQTIPAPFDLANRLEEQQFRSLAWKALCRHLANILSLDETDESATGTAGLSAADVREELQQERLAGLRALIQELHAMDTYLWHEEMVAGHALLELGEDAGGAQHEAELIAALAPHIRSVAGAVSNRNKGDAILAAIATGSLRAMQEAGLLTKDLRIHGTTVSKKVRDKVPADISTIESELLRFSDGRKIRSLNRKGRLSYRFFQLYRFFYNQLRFSKNAAEFSDLVKGSFALFNSDGSLGVKFLLSRTIHHLMLDEFQDTSVLQWSVFREVADHLLAGDSLDMPPGPQPSLFVVGDEKQSIYGFREADPEVMEFVRDSYRDRITVAPMNDSYRTANIILSFVNHAFSALIPEFPRHQTAGPGAAPFIPDHGRVGVLAALPEKPGKHKSAESAEEGGPAATEVSPPEAEAEAIAGLLAHVLSHSNDYPVYDKKTKSWRPIRPDDCAILYRSGTYAGLYDAALRQRDIPSQRDEEKGYFQRPEIADMVALLTYLAAPADLVALLTVAKSRLGAVPDPDTFRALAAAQSSPVKTSEFIAHLKPDYPDFVAAVSELAHAATRIPPHELILQAYRRMNVLRIYGQSTTQSTSEARLAELNLIALIGRTLQAENEGVTNLFDLCRYFASLSTIDETGNAGAPKGAVTLMTIHKSKGLEYPLVILADSGRAFAKSDSLWTQVRRRPAASSQMARREDKVTFSGTAGEQPRAAGNELAQYLEAAEARTAQEAHRLLYVALTRSQHYLFVTGHKPGKANGLAGTTYHPLLQAAGQQLTGAGYNYQAQVLGGFTYDIWERSIPDAIIAASECPQGESAATPQVPHVFAGFRPEVMPLGGELKITSPSRKDIRTDESGGTDQAGSDWQDLLSRETLPPDMAAVVGTLVHRSIEAALRGEDFAVTAAATAAGVTDKTSLKACRELCAKAAASPTLKQLIGSDLSRTEVPLACLLAGKLVRGSADLVIERTNEVVVVDYKSTRFAVRTIGNDLFSRTQLAGLVADRGYDRQLELYGRALAAVHPGKAVRKALWFIDTDYLYWLPDA
jgi:ATP-dependent helicase/nuclease subunit A